jgi:uncharacterized protein YjbI with pentapeptide repeats
MNLYTCKICDEQFTSIDYELTQDESKCILHCEKNGWNKDKSSLFWKKIREKIQNYKTSEDIKNEIPLNLTHTIFPLFEEPRKEKNSTDEKLIWYRNFFENCTNTDEDYTLDIPIDFTKSIFMEDATFRNYTCSNTILFNNVTFKKEIDFYKSHFDKISFMETIFESFALFYDCTIVPYIEKQFLSTIFKKDAQFESVKFGIDNNEQKQYQLFLQSTEFHGRLHFEHCNFFDKLTIENIKNVSYFNIDNCNFKNLRISSTLDNLKIIGSRVKQTIDTINISNVKVDNLIINNYIVNERFIFNNRNKIKSINLNELIFNEKVEMKNCYIDNFSLENTKFKATADFFGSTFDRTNFHKATFEEVVVFENTIFKNGTDFKLTSFEKLGMFKNATFNKSLNLEDSIIQGEMNYFKTKANVANRETARIIKYHFEKIGNKIEANKYHALEMEEHRKDIWSKNYITLKLLSDGLVSFIHWASSNHSSSWVVAFFWILIVGISTNYFSIQANSLNNFFMFSSILTNADKFSGNYIIMAFNKVSLGYLYYQFLISVRKDTRK